jgi:hypothetical protein
MLPEFPTRYPCLSTIPQKLLPLRLPTSSHTAASPDYGAYGSVYTGSLAGVPVIVNGVPVDTPEVAAAKVAQFSAHAHARGHYYG